MMYTIYLTRVVDSICFFFSYIENYDTMILAMAPSVSLKICNSWVKPKIPASLRYPLVSPSKTSLKRCTTSWVMGMRKVTVSLLFQLWLQGGWIFQVCQTSCFGHDAERDCLPQTCWPPGACWSKNCCAMSQQPFWCIDFYVKVQHQSQCTLPRGVHWLSWFGDPEFYFILKA